MLAAALALALAAVPAFRVEGVAPDALAREAMAVWTELEARAAAAGLSPPLTPRPVRLRVEALAPGQAGMSAPGLTLLRPLPSDRRRAALRHELSHQLLWEACSAGSEDRLFHEAFALWVADEAAAWEDGPWMTSGAAREVLLRARTLDAPASRRALSRLLASAPSRGGGAPEPLSRAFARCEAGSRWVPLSVSDLAPQAAAGDALVAVSRHSGEVLIAEGAAAVPVAFGSTLKPFVVAGAGGAPPRLAPHPERPEWACGPLLPEMDVETALLRSCNGYFLDWAARTPALHALGAYGPVLVALGLPRTPRSAAEAIGLAPSLAISPLALAQAYRLLAEARPDLIDALRRNADEGTLSGLATSFALRGVAIKTGTVRDDAERPLVGLIVAVEDDVVWVMVRAGQAPRAFAAELVRAWRRAPHGREAVEVQVLGLVGAERAEARCDGAGVRLAGGVPEPAARAFAPLSQLLSRGEAICLGGSWHMRFPGVADRRYDGALRWSPPTDQEPRGDVPERAYRARRGSDVVLRTTRLLYVAGVLAAEDAALRGEARVALARVVDHDARRAAHQRHRGRPVCDTTHCQVFAGTAPIHAEERRALAAPPLPGAKWLAFSRGGDEPWRERRPTRDVEQALGAGARDLAFEAAAVRWVITVEDGRGAWEEPRRAGCEVLRGPLRLPSCPDRVRREGGAFVFEGRGAGHGEGLDLERAKRSGHSADQLLHESYPQLGDW